MSENTTGSVVLPTGETLIKEDETAMAVIKGKTLQELIVSSRQLGIVKNTKDGEFITINGKELSVDEVTHSQFVAAIIDKKKLKKAQDDGVNYEMQSQIDMLKEELEEAKKLNLEKDKAHDIEISKVRDELSKTNEELAVTKRQLYERTQYDTCNVFKDVFKFTNIAETKLPAKAQKLTKAQVESLKDFITEEFTELEADKGTPWKVADWYVDHIYYIINNAIKHGYAGEIEKVWILVQEANMRKFPDGVAIKDERGKVLKPEGWESNDPQVEQLFK